MARPPRRARAAAWAVALAALAAIPATATAQPAGTPAAPVRPSTPSYLVQFNETGLAAGTLWAVTINGTRRNSTTDAIQFFLTPGYYTFQVAAVPDYDPSVYFGEVDVVASPTYTWVTFTFLRSPYQYNLTLVERGLPPGTTWGAEISELTYTTTAPVLSVLLPTGTYNYTVFDDLRFYPSPNAGSVVLEYSQAILIQFAPVAPPSFPIDFAETGLPSGTAWEVTLVGAVQWGRSLQLGFTEVNGSFFYTVQSVSGYATNVSVGWVRVNGSGTTVLLRFLPIVPGTAGTGFSVLSAPGLAVVGIPAAALLLGVAYVVDRRRRAAHPPTPEVPAAEAPEEFLEE